VVGSNGQFLYLSGTTITGAPTLRYVDASTIRLGANLIPDASDAYDLGSATNPMRSVYVDSSIVLGDGITLTPDVSDVLVTLPSGEQYYLARYPFVASLANKLQMSATSFYDVSEQTLTWSATDTSNQYVPMESGALNVVVDPLDPGSTGVGWRFSKTNPYVLPTVSGGKYTIEVTGTTNWTSIGAPSGTVNTQFIYNGVTATGTGRATTNEKISWYALNALYNQSLPASLPSPNRTIKKCDLETAWVLIKMNSDVAFQGAIAIQIETYAYQDISNNSGTYTGRWAYSTPFSGIGRTTDLSGTSVNRLRSGFMYLLYASDTSPSISGRTGGYSTGGSGMFAPSQIDPAKSLRDPYELYTEYPHLALTATLYSEVSSQPVYGVGGMYTDRADVEVASIYLNTDSTSPPYGPATTTITPPVTAGTQRVMDFNVMAFGYSGLCADGVRRLFKYTTAYM
jgi:hypothetical protein